MRECLNDWSWGKFNDVKLLCNHSPSVTPLQSWNPILKMHLQEMKRQEAPGVLRFYTGKEYILIKYQAVVIQQIRTICVSTDPSICPFTLLSILPAICQPADC